jgi:hypothetical protein
MPKKNMTDEEKKAWGEKMKAARLAKQAQKPQNTQPTQELPEVEPTNEEEIGGEQSVDDLKAQIAEMQQNMKFMQQMMMQGQGPQLNKNARLVGVIDKYVVDPSNYPDPRPRLFAEPRLAPLAFNLHYEMDYEVGVSQYETKSGENLREPKFKVQLNRIVYNDQGEPTDKRYIARKLVFHEDPQAAIVIARENGLEVNPENEKDFLDEMRYLRVRDWLFDIFWPKPADEAAKIGEEVIGGTIVQVYTKSSEDPSGIEFNRLDTEKKVRA